MQGTVANLASLLALGFFLGMRHATDADHVIAIATIVSRQRTLRGSALIGAAWGVGHTLTILVVGGAIILFGVAIPPRLGLTMELAVGVMLILLGILTLTGVPLVPGSIHTRLHAKTPPALASFPSQWIRPLAVGIVHGLAGSAAVALLVLAAVPEPAWAMAYLLLFGVGTVGGMVLITLALSAPFAFTTRLPRLNWRLRTASGLISFAFGLLIIYEIGFAEGGLFTEAPVWEPR